jgi:hypothetical protein
MIASDASLSGSQKAERFQNIMIIDVMVRASGPAPLARTDEKQSRDSRDDSRRWLAIATRITEQGTEDSSGSERAGSA